MEADITDQVFSTSTTPGTRDATKPVQGGVRSAAGIGLLVYVISKYGTQLTGDEMLASLTAEWAAGLAVSTGGLAGLATTARKWLQERSAKKEASK